MSSGLATAPRDSGAAPPQSRLARALSGRGAAVAVLALALAATLAVPPWSDESVGDLGVRSAFAALMLDGEVPYRDFLFEYPPLAAPAIALPGLLGTEEEAYRAGMALAAFLLAVGVVLLAGALARRTGGSPRAAMLVVAASPLLLGAVVRLHFDLLPAALTLGALLAVVAGRRTGGLVLLGVAVMTKGFPIVAAPVFLGWLWGRAGGRTALRSLAAFSSTLLVLGGTWFALSPDGALDSLAYQVDRPVQVESSPGSVLFLAGAVGGEDPVVIQSHRAAGLLHELDGPVGAAFVAILIAVVGILVMVATRIARGSQPEVADRGLVLAALTAVAAFAAFGRVLSPQYLVWVMPLLGLAVAWRLPWLAAAAALACVLTLVEFPFHYLDLLAREPFAVGVTAARNAALAAVVAIGCLEVVRLAGARTLSGTVRCAARAPARSIRPARSDPPG